MNLDRIFIGIIFLFYVHAVMQMFLLCYSKCFIIRNIRTVIYWHHEYFHTVIPMVFYCHCAVRNLSSFNEILRKFRFLLITGKNEQYSKWQKHCHSEQFIPLLRTFHTSFRTAPLPSLQIFYIFNPNFPHCHSERSEESLFLQWDSSETSFPHKWQGKVNGRNNYSVMTMIQVP